MLFPDIKYQINISISKRDTKRIKTLYFSTHRLNVYQNKWYK